MSNFLKTADGMETMSQWVRNAFVKFMSGYHLYTLGTIGSMMLKICRPGELLDQKFQMTNTTIKSGRQCDP
jgi:hypothetical protein